MLYLWSTINELKSGSKIKSPKDAQKWSLTLLPSRCQIVKPVSKTLRYFRQMGWQTFWTSALWLVWAVRAYQFSWAWKGEKITVDHNAKAQNNASSQSRWFETDQSLTQTFLVTRRSTLTRDTRLFNAVIQVQVPSKAGMKYFLL